MDNSERDAALLHAVLDAAVDAVILTDENGVIVKANPAAGEMFGHEPGSMAGKNVNMLMPDALAEQHDGFMRRHIETGEARIIGIGRDVQGKRKDGSVFPLHLSVGETRVDGKDMFVGVMHDLTQWVAMTAALSRSQRLDAVNQMTGGIAHDFNNMLTVIIGNLELLQKKSPNEPQLSLIQNALDAAELGADLTSRLMVFARKSHLKPVEANLRALCEDTLAILKRTLGTRIRITAEYAPRTGRVLVDPVQLQATLVNLALNARDAMKGKGNLLISVGDVTIDDSYMAQEIDVQPGDYVRLAVSDDGAGMDETVQRQAFEPFFTTKPESGGTGLGLSMVYGFVRQSGGHITLYSEPGLGTSFGLYFPALKQGGAIAGDVPKGVIEVDARQLGRGRTVLVVEDNPKVRALSVARFRDLGFETEETDRGEKAYGMLKDGLHADILFSDLVMPGKLNGYDLATKVATEFPDMKILLTSGYASDIVTATLAHGKNYNILHKPFRLSDLILRLQDIFDDEPVD